MSASLNGLAGKQLLSKRNQCPQSFPTRIGESLMQAPQATCSNCNTSTDLSHLLPLRCGCLLCSKCTKQPVSTALASASHRHVAKTLQMLYPMHAILSFIDHEGQLTNGKVVRATWDGIKLNTCSLELELPEKRRVKVGYWQVMSSWRRQPQHLHEGDVVPVVRCPAGCRNGFLDRQDLAEICPRGLAVWENMVLMASLLRDGVVQCPNARCGALVERLQCGGAGLNRAAGAACADTRLKRASEYRERFRYRCAGCSSDFCGVCLGTPYHEGYTCSEAKKPDCRFCCEKLVDSQPLWDMSTKSLKKLAEEYGIDTGPCLEKRELLKACEAVQNICGKDDCKRKFSSMCTKSLPCGHRCCGVRDELHCPSCIEPTCSKVSQTSQDCQICWESLRMGPCIQILCGHVFHLECLRERVKNGFPGPQISFTFMNCPLCGNGDQDRTNGIQIMTSRQALEHRLLKNETKPFLELKSRVVKFAKQHIKLNGDIKNSEELKPGGKFEGRPADFAMSKYLYFQCYKCGSPYFGGNRVCENAQANNRGFDSKELLCGSCSAIKSGDKCPKHGTVAIEWKCKFCCSIASWFCWGTTHMCDACHAKCVTGAPVRQTCTCVGECPLGIEHPPPGQEFCLGCALCRYQHAS